MKLKFFVMVYALLSGFAFAQTPPVKNTKVTPIKKARLIPIKSVNEGTFKVSSLNDTYFAFVGEFEGNYRIFPKRVEVEVTEGKILLRDVSAYKGRRHLLGLSVDIAGILSGRWNVIYSSDRVKIDKIMTINAGYQLGKMKFTIPRDAMYDLSQNWLVFTMHQRDLDHKNPVENLEGTAHAHSDRRIFKDYFNPLARRKPVNIIASKEDCIPYRPAALKIINQGAMGWMLTDGNGRQMLGADNEADAKALLTLAKRYTQHCFIGRGNKRPNRKDYIIEYWK